MENWLETLSPEIKDHPAMANMKTPADVAGAWVNAQKLIGADKIPVPTKDDDPNWGTVYERLGRPKTAAEYKAPEFKDLPEGLNIDPERTKAWFEKAHQLGLSQKQAAEALSYYVGSQATLYNGEVAKMTEAKAAAEKALRAELGAGYDANIALAEKTLKFLYGDRSKEIAAKFGNDPEFIRGMIKAGNELSEDVLGAGSPKPGELTPESAQREISAAYADPNHPFLNSQHPDHKWWVEERMPQLMTLAYPDTE